LSFLFCFAGAVLSAFLDALTVTAVLITISVGFYSVFHKVASGKKIVDEGHDHGNDENLINQRANLEDFRAFLRSLIMHGAVGTALGGVTTVVGEPQNLLIAERRLGIYGVLPMRMAPVTMPVFGLWPSHLHVLLENQNSRLRRRDARRSPPGLQASSDHETHVALSTDKAALITQAVVSGDSGA